jgi:hypothetical protein
VSCTHGKHGPHDCAECAYRVDTMRVLGEAREVIADAIDGPGHLAGGGPRDPVWVKAAVVTLDHVDALLAAGRKEAP